LRAWEERYGVVVPTRSAGAQRLYSRDQIDQLRFVQRLVGSGLQPAEAHRLLAQQLRDGATVVPPGPDETRRAVVLVAERDVYAAEFVEYLLRTEGYDVLVALDVDDALEAYDRRTPDIVMVDLIIDGGVGVELCGRLHEAGASVIATSSLDLASVAIAAGADAFLRKPLDPLQVMSTIKDLGRTSALTRPSEVHLP
jgi:CheY-like chemotaxis protein